MNHAYWALVESYRTERGLRQRIVSYLGQLKESQRPGIKQAANGNKKSALRQLRLFDADNKPELQCIEVDAANLRVENQQDFGGPWPGLQLIHKLKFDELSKISVVDVVFPTRKNIDIRRRCIRRPTEH